MREKRPFLGASRGNVPKPEIAGDFGLFWHARAPKTWRITSFGFGQNRENHDFGQKFATAGVWAKKGRISLL